MRLYLQRASFSISTFGPQKLMKSQWHRHPGQIIRSRGDHQVPGRIRCREQTRSSVHHTAAGTRRFELDRRLNLKRMPELIEHRRMELLVRVFDNRGLVWGYLDLRWRLLNDEQQIAHGCAGGAGVGNGYTNYVGSCFEEVGRAEVSKGAVVACERG